MHVEQSDLDRAAEYHGYRNYAEAAGTSGQLLVDELARTFALHVFAMRAQNRISLIEGARMMQEAALRAHKVAEYDPAPYTKGRYAIQALDPAEIVAKQEV